MKVKQVLMIVVCLVLGGSLLWAGAGQEGAQAASGGGASGPVTIEVMQWWQPEMKPGSFDKMISDFEAKNPNINVESINLPYSQVLEQITIGNASSTLSDVIGVNPPWLSDFIKQGVVEPLDAYISRDSYDLNQLAATLVIDNKQWIFPVTTFLNAVFYHPEHFQEAGLTAPPKNWDEFVEYARKLTVPSKNQYGWVIPLGLANPKGTQHEVLNWAWTGGGRAIKNGLPSLENNPEVTAALRHVERMYKEKLVVPGAFTKVEQEKVEDFASGRASMMISNCAHINLLKQRDPNLKFDIFPVPSPAGFTGKPGLSMNGWWMGMSAKGKNKDAAWKLVQHFLDKDQNSHIASNANAFPGNKNSRPDFISTDPLFAKAFEIYQRVELLNEFNGLPNAPGLQRLFMEEIHALMEDRQDVATTLKNTQAKWMEVFRNR